MMAVSGTMTGIANGRGERKQVADFLADSVRQEDKVISEKTTKYEKMPHDTKPVIEDELIQGFIQGFVEKFIRKQRKWLDFCRYGVILPFGKRIPRISVFNSELITFGYFSKSV